MQHQMALAERASLGILSSQTNRRSVRQNRRKRQRLRMRPIDRLRLVHRRTALLQQAVELGIEVETLRLLGATQR